MESVPIFSKLDQSVEGLRLKYVTKMIKKNSLKQYTTNVRTR